MRPGIFAKTFANESLEASLDGVQASGLSAIQFNLALTGGPSLPDDVPPRLAARVRDGVRARRLDMVAVSGTYNMAHPDRQVRRAGLVALTTVIAAAPALGTRVVTLCTGSRDPHDMWRWHPDNATPDAWADMLESVDAAVRVAAQHDVVLGVEPEHNNVVADAHAARRLLDHIDSPLLQVVIDAANLIGPGQLHRQAEIMEEAFDLLGNDLVLAHAKDVLDDGTVVPAGRGGLDYQLYVLLLRRARYGGAVVLHGLGVEDVAASVAFLRRHLGEQVGSR
jgi:sugar phosphate isomerase/epimerase